MEFSVSLNTDNSGFLRRECSTCEREFKWFYGKMEGYPDNFLDPESYTCPYCGTPSDHDTWWTPAQLEYAQEASIGPIASYMEDEMRRTFGSGAKFTSSSQANPVPPVDPDDMIIVEPPCHPFEPIKVIEDWTEPLHCLVCGQRFQF
jgi:hypothetical protein